MFLGALTLICHPRQKEKDKELGGKCMYLLGRSVLLKEFSQKSHTLLKLISH